MLKNFIADLQAGFKWLSDEMARPMPGVPSSRQNGTNQKLGSRRSRQPAAASTGNNHDEDRHHHHQVYDSDAFQSDSWGDGDGD